jgi:hypothetical protein
VLRESGIQQQTFLRKSFINGVYNSIIRVKEYREQWERMIVVDVGKEYLLFH